MKFKNTCLKNKFIELSQKLVPFFHKIRVTPNQISITGFFIGLLYIHFLNKQFYIYALIMLFFYRLLDYVDGRLARKYNLVTSYGDFLDHSIDICIIVLMFYYTFIANNAYKKYIFLSCIFIPFYMLFILNVYFESQFAKKEDGKVFYITNKILHIFFKRIKYNSNLKYFDDITMFTITTLVHKIINMRI